MTTPTLLHRDVPPRVAFALEQAGVHPLLARLFAARGVRSPDELDDGVARLLPPDQLLGTAEAAVLLAEGRLTEAATKAREGLHALKHKSMSPVESPFARDALEAIIDQAGPGSAN